MSDTLIDTLEALSKGLHWLGKYSAASRLNRLIAILREFQIETTMALRKKLLEKHPLPNDTKGGAE